MMPAPQTNLRCPHCSEVLQAFSLPDNTGWETPYQWACFNDECPYYKSGWDWMWENYEVRASYRYRVVDEKSGQASPLAVWSATALLDRIIKEGP